MQRIFTEHGRELLRFLWHKEEERFLRAATVCLRSYCREMGVPEAEFTHWAEPRVKAAYGPSDTVEQFFDRMIAETEKFIADHAAQRGTSSETDFEIV